MSENSESAYFTPPRIAKPIGPAVRYGMEMNYKTIYVLFCGGFPSLTAHLSFRENVDVYRVNSAEELREQLTGADGIPADLVVIYDDKFRAFPVLPLAVRKFSRLPQDFYIFLLHCASFSCGIS